MPMTTTTLAPNSDDMYWHVFWIDYTYTTAIVAPKVAPDADASGASFCLYFYHFAHIILI